MQARVDLSLLLLFALTTSVSSQGRDDYLNFESPQVKPITVARVDGSDYLLVCNTPDNSVEVYDISGATKRDQPTFVTRIPVGLEPVSVVYHSFATQAKNMMYTVNWLGDSVTFVELSSSGGVLSYVVVQEMRVTDPRLSHDSNHSRCDDEPMHLAVLDNASTQSILVTKRTASSYTQMNALVATVGSCFPDGANVIMTNTGSYPLNTFPPDNPPDVEFAVKEPHTILRRPLTDQIWVLGHQGGGSKLDHDTAGSGPDDQFPNFNLDLWRTNYAGCTPTGALDPIGFSSSGVAMGTTNFNMAFNAEGSALYVVGTDALNQKRGNATLQSLPTGFVKTMLYRIQLLPSEETVMRDLNTSDGTTPVPPTQSLAHATDVAVHRQGETDYVCVVAFNSDRFGVIEVPDAQGATPDLWQATFLDIDPIHDRDPFDPASLGLAGPRGIALLDPVADGTASDVRAYVLNRLDSSVVVIDPKLGAAGPPAQTHRFELQLDPVPDYIRNGQSFLYSTQFSDPAKQFVSCASCHVDGRSDQLQWSLTSDPGPQPLPPTLPSGPGAPHSLEISSNGHADGEDLNFGKHDYLNLVADGFPNENTAGVDPVNAKGPMITQSLQGLVNFEVGGDLFSDDGDDGSPSTNEDNVLDDLVTNAPYHWRGDKEGFRHFNEAFAGLQGMPDLTNPLVADPHGGLTTQQMVDFEQFITSIHYPPNPLQPDTRVYSGTLGAPGSTNGTGAMAGLKLFHTQALDGPNVNLTAGRSCVQCHALPEGSNNRITCAIRSNDISHRGSPAFPPLADFASVAQPLETAALRGLTQKEGRLELNSTVPSTGAGIVTSDRGMGHDGMDGASRNEFVTGFVGGDFIRERIAAFLREFDHGVAPIVGRVEVKVGAQAAPSLAALEVQARLANCGLAAYARVETAPGVFVERGYWYKFRHILVFVPGESGLPLYKQHDSPTELESSALLAQIDVPGEILIVRAVPLGSERRVAAVTGTTPGVGELPYNGAYPAPSQVKIVGTVPNTANAILRDVDPVAPLEQRLLGGWAPSVEVSGGTFVWNGQDAANPPGPVVEPLSLRATRAFQIALSLSVPEVQNAHDVPRRLQVTGVQIHHGAKIRLSIPDLSPAGAKDLILPLYPTNKVFQNKRVWETAVEFDPLSLYTLMLGGPADPDVRSVLQDSTGNPAPILSAAAGSPMGVSYAMSAQNVGGTGWTSQPAATIKYPPKP